MKTTAISSKNIACLQAEIDRLQALIAENQRDISNKNATINNQEAIIVSQETVIEKHQKTIAVQQNSLEQKGQEIALLEERLAILLSKRFQAQSETLKSIQGQLFDEAELEKAIADTQQALEDLESQNSKPDSSSKANTKAQKPKRKALPDHLRRVEITLDVSDDDKQAMGDEWECIGFETAEQLAVHQREYYVKVLKRKKYVRKTIDDTAIADNGRNASKDRGIVVAPTAKVILPRAIADASLLADVLCSKFIDAMSFYRTEKRLQRDGIHIGYSTLCDWPLQLYERLKPFERLFYEEVAKAWRWHLDETTLQVLDEPGKANQTQSYLWAMRACLPQGMAVLFHYDAGRSYEALERWLAPCLSSFGGVVVTDEYAVYNKMTNNYAGIKRHGGCLAHCRRKFADAAKGRRHNSDAHKVLQKIAVIYRQENSLSHLSGEALIEARQEHVKPLMDKLYKHLNALADTYLKKGAMKTAIGYALNNWPKFTAFLDHPDLPIDNNAMERAIRPFTLGRKNFLFAGSPRGASASAFIYSLIESANANNLEPFRYLQDLFEAYPLASTQEERRALLPWFYKFSD